MNEHDKRILLRLIKAIKIDGDILTHRRGKTEDYRTDLREMDDPPLMVDVIARMIYRRYYHGARASSLGESVRSRPDDRFVDRLHAANVGIGWRDRGWEVVGSETGRKGMGNGAFVLKHGVTIWADEANIVDDGERVEGSAPQLGQLLTLLMPAGSNGRHPSFYTVFGNTALTPRARVARFYLNIRPRAAVSVVRAVSQYLHEQPDFPSMMKIVDHPSLYDRSDSCVVYVHMADHPRLWPLLRELSDRHQSWLRRETPWLTKKLAPGIAAAQQPEATDESFGLHRSRLVGQGLLEAWNSAGGAPAPAFVLSKIEALFKANAVDINQPYLNSGESDFEPFPTD